MSLRFMHIPKTAGSTFESILRRQYREKGHFVFSGDIVSDIDRFNRLSALERQKIELFTGHTTIATGLPEADQSMIITILRDPIDRVKSFCQHVSEGKSPHLRRDFPPETFSLDRFLESGNTELSNLQTKILISSGYVLPISVSTSQARDMALSNLYGRVSHFGLAEFFDESLVISGQALNWSIEEYVSINRKDATRLIEFRDRHLSRIAELNSIDIEVYDSARDRFMAIIESTEFDKTRLKFLRSVNRH